MSTEFEQHLEDEQPPLLVTLIADLGKLPKGIRYLFPRDLAIKLIQKRYASPVVDFELRPDLAVDEDQLPHAGLPPGLIPLEAMLDKALEAA